MLGQPGAEVGGDRLDLVTRQPAPDLGRGLPYRSSSSASKTKRSWKMAFRSPAAMAAISRFNVCRFRASTHSSSAFSASVKGGWCTNWMAWNAIAVAR